MKVVSKKLKQMSIIGRNIIGRRRERELGEGAFKLRKIIAKEKEGPGYIQKPDNNILVDAQFPESVAISITNIELVNWNIVCNFHISVQN